MIKTSIMRVKRIVAGILLIMVILIALAAFLAWGGVSNPAGRRCIGEISAPIGFERVAVKEGSFGEFIREFPLQKRGSHMKYFNGNTALGQYWGYAVLDLPMLSSTEQCADAVMRMRAEYLWKIGRYNSIHFQSVTGENQKYGSGSDRKAFENYLRKVYANSNTTSLSRELPSKSFKDIEPGDVFVYESTNPNYYGHAVLVADVAHNPRTGKIAIMLAQSSTPALTMHIIRDMFHPVRSPWVILDSSAEGFSISGIHFEMSHLKEW